MNNNELDYLYKYLKYKYKYLTLQNELYILGGKKKKKKSSSTQSSKSKIKLDTKSRSTRGFDTIKELQNFKITQSVFDNKVFDLIKLGIQTIPGVGTGFAIFDFILMINTFYVRFNNIINSSSALKTITKIKLKSKDNSGPKYVKQQFIELWNSEELSSDQKEFLCKNIKVLIKYIIKLIANFVATIPTIGPIMSAYLLNSNNVLTFDNVTIMFNNLPDEAKEILLDADKIRETVNLIIVQINKKYSNDGVSIKQIPPPNQNIKKKKNKPKQKGKGIVSSLVSQYSEQITQNMPDVSKYQKTAIKSLQPAIKIGNTLGLNVVGSQVTNFIMNQIRPGVYKSIDFINRIFPLLFTLLLIDESDDCKILNKK